MSKKLIKIMNFERCFWDAKSLEEVKDIYLEIFDESLLTNSPLGKHKGHKSLYDTYLKWMEGFPNTRLSNFEFKEAGNLILWDWNSQSKHDGVFCGIEATGKEITYSGRTIYQFNDNKIVDYVCYVDMQNIYTQLGFFLQKEEYEGQGLVKKNYELLIKKLTELTSYNSVNLTKKELEILSCWLFGYSSKSIASQFRVSPRTIESHIEHIKSKLLCNSKYDLQNLINSKKIANLFNDLYFIISKR